MNVIFPLISGTLTTIRTCGGKRASSAIYGAIFVEYRARVAVTRLEHGLPCGRLRERQTKKETI